MTTGRAAACYLFEWTLGARLPVARVHRAGDGRDIVVKAPGWRVFSPD
ncbi:MAG: hypothetical protein RX316_10775 [bacterium]|nr:hypothetical protein [bacterium]